jgi:hypothetical protein
MCFKLAYESIDLDINEVRKAISIYMSFNAYDVLHDIVIGTVL